jgi:DNA-binding beta-propeller fold protein YncE
VHSAPAFTVREKGLVPESVAYDPATKTFFLSSIYRRKILRVTADGAAVEFATERDGLWSVAGMKVDAARRLLWVCTVAHPQMSGYRAEEDGTTALLKFDLRTGKLIKKYVLPNQPKHHWLGDLAITSSGDVYATDSLTTTIYVVRRNRDEIEPFLESALFANPQGLDFAPGEKKMFMADYKQGIFVIDLATKKVTPISPAPDSTLLGIDGLYFHQGALIGVQNGVNPNRIVRLWLSPDFSRVVKFETLEANNPIFDEPTLGVVVKDDLYFIANSQWGAIDEKGNLAPVEKLKDPVILKLKL